MTTKQDQAVEEVIRRARVEIAQRENEDLVAIVLPRGIAFRMRDEVLAGFSDPRIQKAFAAPAPRGEIHVLIMDTTGNEARTVAYAKEK